MAMLSNIRILLIKYKTDVNYQLKIMQFVPTTLTLDSGVTRPLPLLAEADLLSCMDKVQKKKSFFQPMIYSFSEAITTNPEFLDCATY